MSNIFQDCSFYISTGLPNKAQLTKVVKENGGTISFMITNKVTHVVVPEKEFQQQGTSLKKAMSTPGISIVNSNYITDSISDCVKKDPSLYKLTLAPTQNITFLTDSPKKVHSTSFISDYHQEREEKTVTTASKVKSATATNTSKFSFSSAPSTSSTSSFGSSVFGVPPAKPTSSFGSALESTTGLFSNINLDSGSTSSSSRSGLKTSATSSKPYAFSTSLFSHPASSTPSSSTSLSSSTSSFGSSYAATSGTGSFSEEKFELIKNPKPVKTVLYTFGSPTEPFYPKQYEIKLNHTLQFTNIAGSNNNNKYYVLELHEASSMAGKMYRVFSMYGRTDGKSTKETRYTRNLDETLNLYSSIYNEKTSEKKGYKPVSLLSNKMSSLTISQDPEVDEDFQGYGDTYQEDSSLNPSVQELVKFIYREATTQLRSSCSAFITEKGIETPLGVLSMDQVEKGEKILDKIHQELKQNFPLQSKLETLSSEFYTVIPHKMGRGKADVSKSILKNLDLLNDKVELLQLMKDLLKVNSGGALVNSAILMKYQALKAQIEPLHSHSGDYQKISEMVTKTAGGEHSKNLKVLNIYQVTKTGENDSFVRDIKPTRLLFHGSRASNFVGLLSRGLLLPKVITNTGGSRTDYGFLGAGLYFGDKFDTSAIYAHPGTTDPEQRRLMLVNEVALGLTQQYTKINSSLVQPPNGYNSCMGVPSTGFTSSDFKENEYVVYNTNQQRIQYLIEFTVGDKPTGLLGSSILSSAPSFITKKPVVPLKPSATSVGPAPKLPLITKFGQNNINHNNVNNNNYTPQPSSYDSYPAATSSFAGSSPSSPSATFQTTITSWKNFELPNVLYDPMYGEFHDEMKCREDFVRANGAREKADKFVCCEKVFENAAYRDPNPLSIPNQFMVLPHYYYTRYKNNNSVKVQPSLSAFEENWKRFSNGVFDSRFNWNNLFVAGGSVLGCSLTDQTGFENSDIDIFLYGLTEQQATDRLRQLHDYFKEKCPNMGVVRTKFAVTFLNQYPNRNIQVILRIYSSPAEVLMGFDIDCCSIGYDGKNVYALPRARRAIVHGYNTVSLSRRSTTYETRMFKYAKRGFVVVVPGLDRTLVNPTLYTMPLHKAKGFARLLLLEYTFNRNPTGNVPLEQKTDYSECEVPWGRFWTVDSAVSVINYRDRSQFFAKQKDFQHRHIAITGFQHCMDGTSAWCKKCQAGEPHDDKSTSNKKSLYVNGPIAWLTENPGRQMLVGAFHPIEDDKWVETAYLASGSEQYLINLSLNRYQAANDHPLTNLPTQIAYKKSKFNPLVAETNHLVCIAASYGNLTSLQSMASLLPQLVNVATDNGFYPIHYACMSGNLEVVKYLFANGALPHLRSKNSIKVSCLVVARHYNHQNIVNHLSATYPFLRRLKNGRFTNFIERPLSLPIVSGSKNVYEAIINGDVDAVARFLKDPKVPTIDYQGHSLYHYAVISPAPEKMFKCIKDCRPQSAETDKLSCNQQTQSLYHFIKLALCSIEPLTANLRSHGLMSNLIRKELQNLLTTVQKPVDTALINQFMATIPVDSLTSPTHHGFTIAVSGTTNTNNTVFTPTKPQKPGSPTKTSVFGVGGKFSPSGQDGKAIGFEFNPASLSPPLSPNADAPVPPAFSFTLPPQQLPLPTPSTSNSKTATMGAPSNFTPQFALNNNNNYSITNGLAPSQPFTYAFGPGPNPNPRSVPGVFESFAQLPASMNISSPQFNQASGVARLLVLIDQLKSNSKFTQEEADQLKELTFTYFMPIFNSLEAYLLDSNLDNLTSSLRVCLSVANKNLASATQKKKY